jgi:4-azaleucine resistance transporter AzlC
MHDQRVTAPETPVCLTAAGMLRGARAMLFALVSVVLFGMAYGVAARQAGLDGWVAVMVSGAVFAGSSQFAALELLASPVPWLPLVLLVFAVNARHILMGAALYRWFGRLPLRQRFLPAALMTDLNWAQAVQAYDRGERDMGYLVGSGLLLWATWLAGTAAGAALVDAVGFPLEALAIDLVFVIFFVCILTGLRRGRHDDLAWLVAGTTALLAFWLLPANWHVLAGAVAGGIAGMVAEDRRRGATPAAAGRVAAPERRGVE